MPVTYKKIASVTVGAGGAANMQFTSIPGTYTDLMLLWTMRGTAGSAVATYISFNSSTSNFSARYLYGDGASATSGTLARYIGSCPGTNFTASTFANSSLYIPQYAGSTNKSYSVDNVDENNGTGADANLVAGLWSDTSAITSIALTLASGNFVQHSTATLYGISKS
jgi:hypothetical protein